MKVHIRLIMLLAMTALLLAGCAAAEFRGSSYSFGLGAGKLFLCFGRGTSGFCLFLFWLGLFPAFAGFLRRLIITAVRFFIRTVSGGGTV